MMDQLVDPVAGANSPHQIGEAAMSRRKPASFTSYFTQKDADQARAAFLSTGRSGDLPAIQVGDRGYLKFGAVFGVVLRLTCASVPTPSFGDDEYRGIR